MPYLDLRMDETDPPATNLGLRMDEADLPAINLGLRMDEADPPATNLGLKMCIVILIFIQRQMFIPQSSNFYK